MITRNGFIDIIEGRYTDTNNQIKKRFTVFENITSGTGVYMCTRLLRLLLINFIFQHLLQVISFNHVVRVKRVVYLTVLQKKKRLKQ